MKTPVLLVLAALVAAPLQSQNRPCTGTQPAIRTLRDTSFVRPGTVWDSLKLIKVWSESTTSTCLRPHISTPVPPPVDTTKPPVDTTHPPIPPSGFLTPDIINNASYESGWDGFVSLSGTAPNGAVSRTTTRAHSGTTSLEFSWNRNTGDQSSQVAYDLRGRGTHLWARTWFFVTAWPAGDGFKFFRMQDASISGNVIGLQVLNGRFVLITPRGSVIYLGNSLPSLNAWHAVEWEVDVTAHTFRYWVDSQPQSANFQMWSDAGEHATWSNGVVDFKTTNGLTFPGWLDIVRVINPTTNSGSAFFDDVAVSSKGRIGP